MCVCAVFVTSNKGVPRVSCISIACVTSKAGAFMQQADAHHMAAVDGVFAFLATRPDDGLTYHYDSSLCHSKFDVHCYSDASYADKDSVGPFGKRRRCQSGIAVVVNGTVASWKSQAQKSVALSTAEAGMIALSQAAQEVIFVKRFLSFLGFSQDDPVTIFEDNTAAESMANSDFGTKKSRFIDVRHQYCQAMVQEGEISVVRCDTTRMRADMLTKFLPEATLVKHDSVLRGCVKESEASALFTCASVGQEGCYWLYGSRAYCGN